MKNMLIALFVSLYISTPMAEDVHPPAYDCSGVAEHQQFNFWLGEWEVRVADGRKAGTNKIVSTNGRCLLKEEWTNMAGSSGSSLNYYNSVTGTWTQNWVDSQTIINISGGIEDGSMALTGTIYYQQARKQAEFRGTWTPLEDGRVRQFFEEKDAEGKWQVWFEGFYSKVD